MSRVKMQLVTEATHFLESRGRRLEMQLTTEATHSLES